MPAGTMRIRTPFSSCSSPYASGFAAPPRRIPAPESARVSGVAQTRRAVDRVVGVGVGQVAREPERGGSRTAPNASTRKPSGRRQEGSRARAVRGFRRVPSRSVGVQDRYRLATMRNVSRNDIGGAFLEDSLRQFRKYKALADGALAQVDEADLFRTIDPESNSIAVVMKHVAGNMRSRWTDFLTTAGEKAYRIAQPSSSSGPRTRGSELSGCGRQGWRLLFDALTPLAAADVSRTVTVRGEGITVLQASIVS